MIKYFFIAEIRTRNRRKVQKLATCTLFTNCTNPENWTRITVSLFAIRNFISFLFLFSSSLTFFFFFFNTSYSHFIAHLFSCFLPVRRKSSGNYTQRSPSDFGFRTVQYQYVSTGTKFVHPLQLWSILQKSITRFPYFEEFIYFRSLRSRTYPQNRNLRSLSSAAFLSINSSRNDRFSFNYV